MKTFSIELAGERYELRLLNRQQLIAWGATCSELGPRLQNIANNPAIKTPEDATNAIRSAIVKVLHRYDRKFSPRKLQSAPIDELEKTFYTLRDMNRRSWERN